MKIIHKNTHIPNIIHCQGRSDVMENFFNNCISSYSNKNLKCPKNITIITTFTDKSKSPLILQLEYNHIPYINSYSEEYGEFNMTSKIDYIINALLKVKTEFVLVLDGYDVMILNMDNIIDKFKSYETHILWNTSINNYPNISIDLLPWRDYIGRWNHFNAGCCLGYTNDVLRFYREGKLIKENKNINNSNNNPWNSEQFILRFVWRQYCNDMFKVNNFTTIDYKCLIFITMSQAYVVINKAKDEYIIN